MLKSFFGTGMSFNVYPTISVHANMEIQRIKNMGSIRRELEIVRASHHASADENPSGDLEKLASNTPISELMKERKKLDGSDGVNQSLPFTTLQSLISEYVVECHSVPTFSVGYTITTTALNDLYKQIKCKGVTMTCLLAKATALALAQHPVVNAKCTDGKTISYNSSIHLGVVIAIDGGLIAPVLQNADKSDIYSLSREWKRLAKKARTKELEISECMGETFAISNMGMYGVDRFDGGQSSILAIGSSRPTVVASADGLYRVENQMQVNVTTDARIVSEADVAAFLQTLSAIIQNPKDLTR